MKAIRPQLIALAAGSSLASSLAFGNLYGFGPAEAWTEMQIAQLTASVSANIGTFGASFAAQMEYKFEQIISAVAIATKQEALSANVVASNTRESGAALVKAIKAQRETDRQVNSYLRYNGQTGQGFDPCGTQAKNRSMDMAFTGIADRAKATLAVIDTAPGRMVSSTVNAMQSRLTEHRAKFCSQSEANAGLCTLSTLPGGDTNAALLFEPAAENSLTTQARQAYMQHVMGEPDQALPKAAGASPAGEAYQQQKNRKDSLLSVPAYSLAMIDAANTRSTAFGGKSPNEVLSLRVNQYFGGKESQQWSGSLAMQSQRGLLVEAAKMGGLEVWLHQQQYEQTQRLSANLAALVVASADTLAAPLEQQQQKVLSDNAAKLIQ